MLEDVWSEKEVKLLHVRVFICVTYVHFDDQGKNKLDPKSNKYNSIYYGEDKLPTDFGMKKIKTWFTT